MNFQEIVKSRIRKQIQNSNLCLKEIYIYTYIKLKTAYDNKTVF